jgi:8-oxo-dGTP pyrophosphatase MutT (NUDIX family)
VTEAISRRAGRVLLLDATGRVLLFHGRDPGRAGHEYWFTPGGGLDPGETTAQAAARELFEEAGLAVDAAELGEPVWREVTEFPFDGRWFRQAQDFFLLRVDSWEVDTSGFDEIELGSIDGYRWWDVAELEGTGERYYPAELPALLRSFADRHGRGTTPAVGRPPAPGELEV